MGITDFPCYDVFNLNFSLSTLPLSDHVAFVSNFELYEAASRFGPTFMFTSCASCFILTLLVAFSFILLSYDICSVLTCDVYTVCM
jgi:hypothetical protein